MLCAKCIEEESWSFPEGKSPNFFSINKKAILTPIIRDYGFAWTPHGTYARDLAHFVNRFGFTPHESIIAATYGMAKLFMRSHEMGQIKEGNYADCLVVDGDPLKDVSILQDHDRLNIIMINGRIHKAGVKEYVIPMQDTTGVHSMTNEMVHFGLQRPIHS